MSTLKKQFSVLTKAGWQEGPNIPQLQPDARRPRPQSTLQLTRLLFARVLLGYRTSRTTHACTVHMLLCGSERAPVRLITDVHLDLDHASISDFPQIHNEWEASSFGGVLSLHPSESPLETLQQRCCQLHCDSPKSSEILSELLAQRTRK